MKRDPSRVVIGRVFFTPRGKEIDTMLRLLLAIPRGRKKQTGKWERRRRGKSRRFLTCNSFDDDGGGDDGDGGSAAETAYETEREPQWNNFPV